EESALAVGEAAAFHIMTGGERMRAEIARGIEQVGELDALIAGDARDRRFARSVAFDEGLDHGGAEALLIVEHVVCDAATRGDGTGVVNILTGATGALAACSVAMVVKLECDAHDVVARALQERGDYGGIDAAGHGDDDSRVLGTSLDIQIDVHGLLDGR